VAKAGGGAGSWFLVVLQELGKIIMSNMINDFAPNCFAISNHEFKSFN